MWLVLYTINALLASLAAAADGFTDADFRNDPYHIAQATRPMFHFAAGSCYPQSANDGGSQHKSSPRSGCIFNKNHDMSAGCQYQIPYQGPNQKGVTVPLYYSVQSCNKGAEWRLYYGLYFDHDQGHTNDWEWVVVVFKNDGHGVYHRDYIIMEQDGSNARYSWTDSHLQTFDDESDIWANGGGQNKSHPKVYVGNMHHSMWPTACTHKDLKDDCFATYRPDDWYMFDFGTASNLVAIDTPPAQGGIDPAWDFGHATNPWKTVGGMCNMCEAVGKYNNVLCGADPPNLCLPVHHHSATLEDQTPLLQIQPELK